MIIAYLMQNLHQALTNGLAFSRWTDHHRHTGMIDFYSRPVVFMILDEKIYQLALAIIHLLTQGFYRLDVRRALHSVN
jgi:hypothetical protein